MKRYLSIFMVLLMVFSFCACGRSKGGTDKVTFAPTTTESKTEEKTTEESTTETTTKDEEAEKAKAAAEAYEEGLDYWFGRNGTKYDPTKALSAFTKAAKNGNADAFFWMGMITERETDPERWEKVMKYFETAIKQGSDLGYYGMGLCYYYGCGVKKDYDKVAEYAKQSIDGGGLAGRLLNGILCRYGHGVTKNGKKAVSHLTQAAKSDDWFIRNRALYELGSIYINGINTDNDNAINYDFEKSQEYLNKAIKDEYFAAAILLAGLYDDDEVGLGNDPEKNFKLRKTAAKGGYYYNLGLAYLYGTGVETDYDRAMELFLQDVEIGKSPAYSMYAIGWMYHHGKGVKADDAKAREWCEKAIESTGIADAGGDAAAKKMLEVLNGG